MTMPHKPRILLIRSLETITPAADYLRFQGLEVVKVPLIKSCKLPVAPQLLLQQFTDCDGVICLSQNAATHLRRFQGMLRQKEIFAIGQSTATLLKPLFQEVQVPEEHTSEGLLQLLATRCLVGRRFLVIKGKGGRNWLQSHLHQLGAITRCLDLYERTSYFPAVIKEPETIKGIDAIFVTSGELLAAAIKIWGDCIRAHLWLVPSARVERLAHDEGINRCVNVGDASIAAMYTTFKNLRWNS